MLNEGELTDVLDLLREMREEIRLEKSKREEREREWEEEKERGREREREWREQLRKRDEELESWRKLMKEVKEGQEKRKSDGVGGASTSFVFVVLLNKQQIVDCDCVNNYGRPELFISDFSVCTARFGH